jgi:hypothetical protein
MNIHPLFHIGAKEEVGIGFCLLMVGLFLEGGVVDNSSSATKIKQARSSHSEEQLSSKVYFLILMKTYVVIIELKVCIN